MGAPASPSGSRASTEPSCTVSAASGFDPSRELAIHVVANEFGRQGYPTVASAIRCADQPTLATAPGVAVDVVERIFEAAQNVDYFEGNGGYFIDLILAAIAMEAQRVGTPKSDPTAEGGDSAGRRHRPKGGSQ
jgi:hypothetical protein